MFNHSKDILVLLKDDVDQNRTESRRAHSVVPCDPRTERCELGIMEILAYCTYLSKESSG